MNQQVEDLREEGAELFAFLDTLSDDQWSLQTPFKGRTVNWVVQHLHDADRWAGRCWTAGARTSVSSVTPSMGPTPGCARLGSGRTWASP